MSRETSIAQAVGTFLSAYRTKYGFTLDEVARKARECGASWSGSSVKNIENGSATISLANLLSLALALNMLTPSHEPRLTLSDLLGEAEYFTTPAIKGRPVAREWVDWVLSGNAVTINIARNVKDGPELVHDTTMKTLARLNRFRNEIPRAAQDGINVDVVNQEPASLAEERAANKLAISVWALQVWCEHLFGHSLEAEANRRALIRSGVTGKPVTPQTRGAMTRAIIAEIGQAREKENDGSPA